MEVLRTAFQTSLVLEWGGAVAVALVAVEISLRLMSGAIAFDRALAVLIIVPEFFLPLRTLATRYHAGAAGRTVAERIVAILDEPLPAGPVPEASASSGGALDELPADADDPVRAGLGHLPGTRRCRPSPASTSRIPSGRSWLWWGRPVPARPPWRTCSCGSSSPTPARILVGDVPLAAIDPSVVAGERRVGPAAAAPVPRHGRRQHPAGPTGRHGRRGGRQPPSRPARTPSSRPPARATTRRSGRTVCA